MSCDLLNRVCVQIASEVKDEERMTSHPSVAPAAASGLTKIFARVTAWEHEGNQLSLILLDSGQHVCVCVCV